MTENEISVTPIDNLESFLSKDLPRDDLLYLLTLRELTAKAIDAEKDRIREDVKAKNELLKRVGGEVTPKFVNPANPKQTWSGRGKRPKWYADLNDNDEKGVTYATMITPSGVPF